MLKKQDGFNGQKTIVVPKPFRDLMSNDPLSKQIFVTDIGYYPQAHGHYRTRVNGSLQHILIHCVEGSGWVKIDGHTHNLSKGSFIIIEAGKPHTYAASYSDPWSIYWLHFAGDNAYLFSAIYNEVIDVDDNYTSTTKERSRLFDEIYQNLDMGYSIENIQFCSISLWYLLGSLRYMSQYREIDNPYMADIIQSSIYYMKENISEKLTLDMIASSVSYSSSHFNTLFTKKTGLTPLNYFNNLKVQAACQYLDFTTLRIKEIAVKLGFYDQYYFSKVFSKYMGYTPTGYRDRKLL